MSRRMLLISYENIRATDTKGERGRSGDPFLCRSKEPFEGIARLLEERSCGLPFFSDTLP